MGFNKTEGAEILRQKLDFLQSARFGELHTVADVLDHLNHGGLRHLIQAGIDRANQTFSKTSHMVGDWRILPNQFTYQVKIAN